MEIFQIFPGYLLTLNYFKGPFYDQLARPGPK